MLLTLLAFLAGALTILSPCILPVLPFVFARQERSFARGTLPLLAGMALTFALIATLAAVGGAWAVRVNSVGRAAALLLLALFGAALLSTRFADWLARPFVALGNRLLSGAASRGTVVTSAVLGVATGLLWAPCAGPVLGLILTGAALNGPSVQTTLLLFAYALGAITSLALATLAGARLLRAFKSSLPAADWVRRGLGVAVLAAVAAIVVGWDTGILTRLSYAGTNSLEQRLLERLRPPGAAPAGAMQGAMTGAMNGHMSGAMTGGGAMGGAMAMQGSAHAHLPVEGELPPLTGAVAWLNSPPLTAEQLRGKVVLVDFWTYSCINCLRTLPYLRAWYERYKDHGLLIIGVHSPEFAFEKNEANVRRAVRDLDIRYPVAIDNDYAIWRAFDNQYWPAHYFVDASGQIRGHHFGEGGYQESEDLIRELLTQAGAGELPPPTSVTNPQGIEAAPDVADVASPETYVGYERAQHFAAAGGVVRDAPAVYAAPSAPALNDWSLTGGWTVGPESAVGTAGGGIVFRFHARDLHLVLGPSASGAPVHFRVKLDGREPGAAHGADTDAHGNGVVRGQRLYQLIRQDGAVGDRTFSIEFLDPGVQAYSFTFG